MTYKWTDPYEEYGGRFEYFLYIWWIDQHYSGKKVKDSGYVFEYVIASLNERK